MLAEETTVADDSDQSSFPAPDAAGLLSDPPLSKMRWFPIRRRRCIAVHDHRLLALALSACSLVCAYASPVEAQTSDATTEVQGYASEFDGKLPQKIDDYTTLIAVTPSGVTLTYSYILDLSDLKKAGVNVNDAFMKAVRSNTTKIDCNNPKVVQAFKRGVIYHYIYFDTHAKQIGTFDVTSDSCNSWNPARSRDAALVEATANGVNDKRAPRWARRPPCKKSFRPAELFEAIERARGSDRPTAPRRPNQ
jgi:hypothetical protein